MKRILSWASLALAIGVTCPNALAVNLLADPGFEDTRPLLPEGPDSDPWRLTFFTPAPVSTSATTMPASGLEHGLLTKDQSLPNADPQLDTAVFAGFGPAESILDFTGEELILSIDYLVPENTISANGEEPGTFLRMFASYFGANGFLGFGSFAESDVFISGTTDAYQTHSFVETVPDFGQPITIVSFNVANLGQSGADGTSVIFLDNASLSVVPEPTSAGLVALVAGVAAARSRRRLS